MNLGLTETILLVLAACVFAVVLTLMVIGLYMVFSKREEGPSGTRTFLSTWLDF